MLKIIALVIVVLVGGILLFAASRPDSFRVERSVSVRAPPEKIFGQISDLKAWAVWSPYEKKDPAMKRTFGAVTAGKGGTTTVTWAMYGPANFVSKLMGVFFSMDKMIGSDFETGLANLKAISET